MTTALVTSGQPETLVSTHPVWRLGRNHRVSVFLLGLGVALGAGASTVANAKDAVSLVSPASMTPATPAVTAAPSEAARSRLAEQYGRLPISFEANRGQTDSPVKFLSRGPGYALFLTANEAVMILREVQAAKTPVAAPTEATTPSAAPKTSVLRWQLVGANPDARVAGEKPLPGHSNYLVGNDAKQWHVGVEHYAQVRYEAVYPGIDLVYHGSQQHLEYDFIVAPGADPGQLRLRYRGQQQLSLNAQGDLVLTTAVGDLVQHKPVIYQTVEGERRLVDGRFELKPSGDSIEVAFAVAAYDRSQPLVIDPALAYSTYLGGSNSDTGYGIAVDGTGNAYVTGQTTSTNFPMADALQGTLGGTSSDVFVTKLNTDGSALVYSTYLGGSSDDYGRGIAVDNAGNATVTGTTSSTDFPLAHALQGTFGGEYYEPGDYYDAFVTKLDASGSALVYSTYLGGNSYDYGYGIAVDNVGNAYVTGATYSTNFLLAHALQGKRSGSSDAFVTKFNTDGSALVYSTYLGGKSSDYGYGIAVDNVGNAYVTGTTYSANFPLAGALQGTLGGSSDAFVTQLNAGGSALVYSTYLGGNYYDYGYGIALDSAGNATVTGTTYSTNFPTAHALKGTLGGSSDAFVTQLNSGGNALAYSTYLGGSDIEDGFGIAVDGSGNATVTGYTTSYNFPLAHALQGAMGSITDAFITKLDAGGSALVYSTYLGGNSYDYGYGIAVDDVGNAYMTGNTYSTNFPTAHALQGTLGGGYDAFISKIDGNAVADDQTPDPFNFPNKKDQVLDEPVTSKVLSLTGFDAPVSVTISGGQYSINGGPWTSAAGVLSPGNTVKLTTTSAATVSTAVTVHFTAGTVTDNWTVTTAATDTTPDPYRFSDKSGVTLNTAIKSQTLTLTGFGPSIPVSISGGEYRLNDGTNGDAWTSDAGSLIPGDTVQLRTTSAATAYTAVTVTFTAGTVTDSWIVTTGADTTPDPFNFIDQNDVAPNTEIASETLTLTGFDASIPVWVSGGSYRINGGSWTTSTGSIVAGDTVQLKATSAGASSTAVTMSITAGAATDNWTVSTGADTTPDPFYFPDASDVALSTSVKSATVKLTGYDAGLPVSIAGGKYRINGGDWTNAAGSLVPGDTLQLKTTSAATAATAVKVTLTTGTVIYTWTVTTVADTTPDAFSFPAKTGAAPAVWVSSAAVTPTGYDTPAPVSVGGGQYRISIDGVWGAWTSAAGTISPTQKVQLRVKSASTAATTTQATLTVGGVSASFSVTTAP